MRSLHFPDIEADAYIVNSQFKRVGQAELWQPFEPSYVNGQINHYWTKSFEEFALKKARGDGMASFARDFESFFRWNGEETEENYTPPPEPLVVAVESEIARLLALPEVAKCMAEIHDRFPKMLEQYEARGGLRAIYEAALMVVRQG